MLDDDGRPWQSSGMTDYYTQRLAGRRLQRVYEIAPPRVRQYLESEIQHVQSHMKPDHTVLELGCGYGRVALRLAEIARWVAGIDVAEESLLLARELSGSESTCDFYCMDALHLGFQDATFDRVVCVQNGICAFRVDTKALLAESLRVLRTGGLALFSTYTDAFWEHRLAWFEQQAAEGLLGPIDYTATGNGVIVCTDGFRSARLTADELTSVCRELGLCPVLRAIDDSSLFCEIRKHG